MSVDFDAIARQGRCDVSSLRLALPLLEQGYTPPFLARYRRDELAGIDEASLWALSRAIKAEQQISARREQLKAAWEQTPLRDPALAKAIDHAKSPRLLSRLARRMKREANDTGDDATRLAIRILNPRKSDGDDPGEVAAKVAGVADPATAVSGLDQAILQRLLGDPRVIGAATRWLARHAKVYVEEIRDPHLTATDQTKANAKQSKRNDQAAGNTEAAGQPGDSAAVPGPTPPNREPTSEEPTSGEPAQAGLPNTEPAAGEQRSEHAGGSEPSPLETSPEPSVPGAPDPVESTDSPPTSVAASIPAAGIPAADVADTSASAAATPASTAAPSTADSTAASPETATTTAATPAAGPAKQAKKVSPRQRRRRWLIGVLKPLSGKRLKADKLSAFQIVMLGRALRSQVAKCAFEYDAGKLVAELQNAAASLNKQFDAKLRQLVLDNEASLREAAETAWWDDLAERASTRLVGVTADHLRRNINRGGVEAQVVMAIDAVGPRTAATAIVAADGRMLHSEDIPCQLSASQRSVAVTKIGELIHHHQVDLIVVSNGPARRATMIALGDLIKQSPENSVRWTLADRNGADAYSGSAAANQEMKSTPRRFRAAAWLAFSILRPAQAITKIDPLKMRLSSFQRELSDDAIAAALEDVLVSGAARGGVDVNAAPVAWLARLPGITATIAAAIDSRRRESLFDSRHALAELDEWETAIQTRQALPFLRVFGGQQVLDGTLIHPDDYALAEKLARSLEIELPPPAPPGYRPPDYQADAERAGAAELSEVESAPEPIQVEDFASKPDDVSDFTVDPDDGANASDDKPAEQPSGESSSIAADGPAESAEDTPVEPQAAEAAGDTAPAPPLDGDSPLGGDPQPAGAGQPDKLSPESPSPQAHAAVRRPLPEKAKVNKCVKEWQIGANRAHQIVRWLCDPFGDDDVAGSPPAVLTSMPTAKSLQPGDQVIGVVVSVMPFGAFVELAPDCSGLIHVSRVADSFVEDLHEAVQVGDVITAWVVGIDDKRRRVGLSAISPERQRAIDEQKAGSESRGRGRHHDRSQPGRGKGRGRPSGPAAGGGGRPSGNRSAAGRSEGGRSESGTGQPRGKRSEASRGSGRGDRRGGRSRDQRGGRKSQRQPESYRVASKEEVKPITEEMQTGKEPMRSFGDLAQFFGAATSDVATANDPPAKQPPPQPAEQPDSSASTDAGSGPNADTANTSGRPPADESTQSGDAPATTEPGDAKSSSADPPPVDTPAS